MSEEQSRPGEPVEQGEGAEGFPHGSRYPLWVAIGLLTTFVGLEWLPMLVVGVPSLAYGLWGWTREYAIEEYERAIIPEQKRQRIGTPSIWFAAIIAIIGELIVFGALFISWFYLEAVTGPFPIGDLPAPSITLGVIETGLLLVGSASIAYGRHALKGGNRSTFEWLLGLTLLTGIGYLAVLGWDWWILVQEGLTWRTGAYGPAYYAVTGVHAGHVVVGLLIAGVAAYRAWVRDHFSADRHMNVSTAEGYWHMLTFVSVLILAFIYFPIAY